MKRVISKPHPLTPSPNGEGEAYGGEGEHYGLRCYASILAASIIATSVAVIHRKSMP